jgi:hypothetical protein
MTTVVAAEGAALSRILETGRPLEGLSAAAYTRLDAALVKTSWGGRHVRRVAMVDAGNVFASAEHYDLTAILDGRPVRVCGIGSLFPDPTYGTIAHLESLLDFVLADALAGGAQLAVTFSSRQSEWLARRGFDPIPRTELELTVIESPRRGAPMTLVRAGDERDLPAIAAMGQIRAASFRFHLDRDVELIQYAIARKRLVAGLGASGVRELQFFVAEEGVTAAAYLVLSVTAGNWTIEECGDRDPCGARVGAMLQALTARDPGGRRPVIRGWLPPGFVPPQVAVVSAGLSTESMMVRCLGETTVKPKLAGGDVVYWQNDLF